MQQVLQKSWVFGVVFSKGGALRAAARYEQQPSGLFDDGFFKSKEVAF